ncbi:MAG: sensor histidine kinase [Acidobacteriota bacterium]
MTDLPASFVPAMLDAFERAGIGIVVLVQRDIGGLEKGYINAPAAQQMGYTPEEWLAEPAFQLLAPELRERIARMYERLAQGHPLPAAIELRLRHRDGHYVTLEYAMGRGRLPEGHAIVLLARDTGPKPAAQLSLLEADRVALVGALAAGFAHETNNPLTSVLLNLRSLRKQITMHVDASVQSTSLRCLDDITTGAERIASNVRALQTLATRTATQPIDLAAVVSSALRLAAPTLEPRAHVIRQIFPVRPVVGEESRIGQAVLAMLLFSVSGFLPDAATAATARITVAVEERDRGVVVEVSDNGRELTPQEVEHAFDPFFRSSVRGAGVGVGLGVARSVASTLGGQVTLATRDGGGAVITMWLPAAPQGSAP